MAIYILVQDNDGASLKATAAAASNSQLSLIRFRIGRSTGSTSLNAGRCRAHRSTGGTTPVSYTPEKLNSRSPSAASTCTASWTSDPSTSANQTLCFPIINQEPQTNWTPPRPWAQLLIQDTEQCDIKGPATASQSFDLHFAEPDAMFRISRLPRRPRRKGLWSYCSESDYRRVKTSTNAYEIQRRVENRFVAYVVTTPDIRRMNWLAYYVAAGGTEYTQSASGSVTPAGALTKQTGKPTAGTLTSAGDVSKQARKILAGVLTSAGALTKQVNKALSGTLTSAGTLIKQTGKILSGTLASAGTQTRQTNKSLEGTLAGSGSQTHETSKLLGGTLSSSGALSTTFIPGGTVYTQSIGGTLTSSGVLTTVFVPAPVSSPDFAGYSGGGELYLFERPRKPDTKPRINPTLRERQKREDEEILIL